jgi:hypothetical protein
MKIVPWNGTLFARGQEESELEHGQTKHRDRTVAIIIIRLELEAKRRAKDDSEEAGPTDGEPDPTRERKPRPVHKRDPDGLDRTCDNTVGDEAEGDDEKEEPCPEGLYDPPMTGRLQDGRGDPPAEDDGGEADEQERPQLHVELVPPKLSSGDFFVVMGEDSSLGIVVASVLLERGGLVRQLALDGALQ